jgi:Spy/CpxP family protein refolding chaperone
VPRRPFMEGFRMSKISQIAVLAAVLAALPAAFGQAEDVALNINPGLWEVTSSPHISGSIPDTANLTADQRAKLEAAMGKAMQPRTYRECMTREKLQHAFDQPQPGPTTCQRTILTNTPTELQMRTQCKDSKGTHQMMVDVKAPGPETMTGTVNIDTGRSGKIMTINNTLEGKWLGPDCGNVTDIEPVN